MKTSHLIPTLIPTLIVALFLGSCSKYNTDINGDVEIYILSTYQTRDPGSAILIDGMELSRSPIISYDELLKYNSRTYQFSVPTSTIDKLEDKFGSAFAITINKEVIYTGYFWAAYSSSTVDWVTIDILGGLRKDRLEVSLGYPGMMIEWDIPDKRNDRRILSVFARDGKLID